MVNVVMENYFGTLAILGLTLLRLQISVGYDNLSTGRGTYTWMSSVYVNLYPARLAVDGQYNKMTISQLSCAQSGTGQSKVTWRIDLGDVRSIKSVQIYYRNEDPSNWDNSFRGRFAGFFVYASNTTSKQDGYLCYHELQNGQNSPPPIFTVLCVTHARYIIYYNERKSGIIYPSYYGLNEAFVELCEVVVLGCAQRGVYGENCNMSCPTNCQEKRCSIDNGMCLGCDDGYTGLKCDTACMLQHYGQECKKTCGNCLNNVPCHHVNGSCLNGCSAGWKLDKCVTPCDPGTFGLHCKGVCNVNCKTTHVCNHLTGKCDGGCKDGFQGDICDRKCDGNMYGTNCNTPCGTCIGYTQCHHINGSCLTGCDKGFKGDKCTTECEPTKYGENCRYNCSTANCVNQTCNGQTGVCIQSLYQNEKDLESSSTAPIIAGVLATVVFVIVLVVVVILLKRKRIRKDSSGEGRLKETSKLKSTDSQAISSLSQNVGKNNHKTGKSTTESQKVKKASDKMTTSTIRAAADVEPDNNIYQQLREEGLYDRHYTTCANYSLKSKTEIENLAEAIKEMSEDDLESLKAEYPEEYQNFSRVLSQHIENKNKKVYYNLQSTRLV